MKIRLLVLILFVISPQHVLISGLKCHQCRVMPGVDDRCPCDTDPNFGSCTGRSRTVEQFTTVNHLWSPQVTDALMQSPSSSTKKIQEACAIIVYEETGSGTLQGLSRNATTKVGMDNYFPDDANCDSLRAAPPGIYAWGVKLKKFRIVKSCVCFTDFCNSLVVDFSYDGKNPLVLSSSALIVSLSSIVVTQVPCRRTILRQIQHFRQHASLCNYKSKGRPRTARTEENREIITEILENRPDTSARQLVRETGISRHAVRSLIKDAGFKMNRPTGVNQNNVSYIRDE
ncbi:unnamed protein product [Allacma fusca]|uniref:Uncharacterized protein n=1 Tax=Allacma fusca TaxID=39272 RepID=A0A8J2PQN0_9HEXA|nr:unnamed protein product [Allacma fusca]